MNSWNVTLPPELAEFVNDQLANKAWGSADNLFAAAVFQLQTAIAMVDSMDRDWLRAQIQEGIDSADRGELIDAEEVFSRLQKELDDVTAKEANDSGSPPDLDEPKAVHVFHNSRSTTQQPRTCGPTLPQ